MSQAIRLLLATVLVALCPHGKAIRAEENVDFATEIQPILQSRCSECHGIAAREGGLRLTSQRDLVTRNDSGEPAVVPGNSRNSRLIARVTATEDRMPPEGEPLTQEQIDLLKRWIDEGAEWPQGEQRSTHWAYVPPVRPELPELESEWVQNPIDLFVLDRLNRESLVASPVANPATLLRRVYLDLIGIPPTVEEVDAYLRNPSEEHYELIVDMLLSSPRYGEKWARPWLDLARYADSNGYQADQFRDIYAYRDWVIQAMNKDMPFDQFTIEQMAGDLLPDATVDQRIATGFHRCTTCNVEAGVDPEENRVNQIIDRVNTTGAVWLGTTLECAQCHNHKYDPFTQQDYYQLFAFFNNTPLEVELTSGVQYEVAGPKMELPLTGDRAIQREQLLEEKAGLTAQVKARRKDLAREQADWEKTVLAATESVPVWHTLTPETFVSSGGAGHGILEDNSILLTGDAPAKDEYTVTFITELQQITGFRLEALTDDSLPGKGPGRGDAIRPNFVLYEFDLQVAPVDESVTPAPVKLKNARADFSQNNWNVSGLIDGKSDTGWAINPQFGQPHWASFEAVESLGFAGGTRFTLKLPQHFGGARTLGRFRVLAMTGNPAAQAVPAEILTAIRKPADKRTRKEQTEIAKLHESSDSDFSQLQSELASVDQALEEMTPPTTLVMVEQDEPRMTNIFKRGNFLDPLAQVEPETPSALPPMKRDGESGRASRLDFARWLASRENPLVARVTVNRWWGEFFGQGLVGTLEDFGSQGEPASHPELLDWLAVEFMDHGWSMKHIHKLIVLSATYQQDSRITSGELQRDPYNRFYSRGPRIRLPAETIRDNALAISGLLSTKMGGPPVYPPQPENIWRHVGRNAPKYDTDTDEDRFRRGIYVVWRRSAPYPSFVNFDAPDRGACVVKRSRTNTPLQALTLLNDPAYVEMAWNLARKMASDDGFQDERSRIEYGFRRTLSRTPASAETSLLLSLYERALDRYQKSPEEAEKMIPTSLAWKTLGKESEIPVEKLAAYFEVANVLLNLDECITKN